MAAKLKENPRLAMLAKLDEGVENCRKRGKSWEEIRPAAAKFAVKCLPGDDSATRMAERLCDRKESDELAREIMAARRSLRNQVK